MPATNPLTKSASRRMLEEKLGDAGLDLETQVREMRQMYPPTPWHRIASEFDRATAGYGVSDTTLIKWFGDDDVAVESLHTARLVGMSPQTG